MGLPPRTSVAATIGVSLVPVMVTLTLRATVPSLPSLSVKPKAMPVFKSI